MPKRKWTKLDGCVEYEDDEAVKQMDVSCVEFYDRICKTSGINVKSLCTQPNWGQVFFLYWCIDMCVCVRKR